MNKRPSYWQNSTPGVVVRGVVEKGVVEKGVVVEGIGSATKRSFIFAYYFCNTIYTLLVEEVFSLKFAFGFVKTNVSWCLWRHNSSSRYRRTSSAFPLCTDRSCSKSCIWSYRWHNCTFHSFQLLFLQN